MTENAITALGKLATAAGFAKIAVSRATWIESWRDLPDVAPVVGGQTVWPHYADVLTVVEHPNWFGRIERVAPPGPAAHVCWWSELVTGMDQPCLDASVTAGSTEVATNLAGTLRQIAGVRLPHGQPESPWLVVSLPGSATDVAAALDAAGYGGCLALGREFAEFPGGLRMSVTWSIAENKEVAALIRQTLDG